MPCYFVVSIIHRTLSWTTGSLTCVCDLFACVYRPRFISHPKDVSNDYFSNSWNTKYSKNILSVKQILLECPITIELFQKNGYDFNDCSNVRDILCNTDVIISIVKLIVHGRVC